MMGTNFKVNSPHIVHETIEGETIIMDLRTGNYYSIEWPGTFIWEFIAETGNAGALTGYLLNGSGINSEVASEIKQFITRLTKEGLLVEYKEEMKSSELSDHLKNELKKLSGNFKKPDFSKYTDMQEMLLLDPIHDVDETGWPEPKKDNE